MEEPPPWFATAMQIAMQTALKPIEDRLGKIETRLDGIEVHLVNIERDLTIVKRTTRAINVEVKNIRSNIGCFVLLVYLYKVHTFSLVIFSHKRQNE
jgi:hypothetical protein